MADMATLTPPVCSNALSSVDYDTGKRNRKIVRHIEGAEGD